MGCSTCQNVILLVHFVRKVIQNVISVKQSSSIVIILRLSDDVVRTIYHENYVKNVVEAVNLIHQNK